MKIRDMKRIFLSVVTLFICNIGFAKLWLPTLLSDNMVLQQESDVKIWGWTTDTAETITVYGSWNNEKVEVKAYQGSWSVQLPTPSYGGPFTLTIEGHEKIVLKNVLIGEVWVCSGQSNMEWTPEMGLVNAEEEIAGASHENIRFFTVPKHTATTPQDNTSGNWSVCSPETMKNFSSVAYFFGRKLNEDLEIPIGLINTSWGGTPVEAWIDEKLIKADKELNEAAEKLEPVAWWPNEPGLAYNAMIYPLLNFEIAGCIWYQGESNRQNNPSYYRSFPLMIEAWRKDWDNEFPFYFVQIAPYKYDDPRASDAAFVRDAQLNTLKTVAKTGMAVTNDIGNLENIHPTNKQDVGRRLALWALAKTYDKKDVVYSGPIYSKMETKKNKITLHFDHADGGLEKNGKMLSEFTIAGDDQIFYPAKAKIKGSTVMVSASEVKNPVAVRFAFTNGSLPNLFNKEGLPASAFRTDNWPVRDVD